MNQLRFGYTRRGFNRASLQTGQPASQASGIPNIPASAFSDALPTYDVVGFQQLGPPLNGNAAFTTSVTQIVDNLSWLRGRHSMKLGTDWRIEHLGILQPPSPTGSFQFHQYPDEQPLRCGSAGDGDRQCVLLLSPGTGTELLDRRAARYAAAAREDRRILFSGRLQSNHEAHSQTLESATRSTSRLP